MLTHIDLMHHHRPFGVYDARQEWTGGCYEMRGAVPITCGEERGTATALVYRFDVHDGKHGIGTLSVELHDTPAALREALRECTGTLSVTVDIGGIVVPAGSYVTEWTRRDTKPASFTTGPVKQEDVTALMMRLKWPSGSEHISALDGGARDRSRG